MKKVKIFELKDPGDDYKVNEFIEVNKYVLVDIKLSGDRVAIIYEDNQFPGPINRRFNG